jgi:hypothetical protein
LLHFFSFYLLAGLAFLVGPVLTSALHNSRSIDSNVAEFHQNANLVEIDT